MQNANDGFLKFPLHEREVQRMIDPTTQSEFGNGGETVLGSSMKNAIQLIPEEFQVRHLKCIPLTMANSQYHF